METYRTELYYVLLLFVLFIVPRMLQRFRLPNAITCVAIGAVLGMGFGLFTDDSTIRLLSTLGIVTLFLFAGLEVDFTEIVQHAGVVGQHLLIVISTFAIATLAVFYFFDIGFRESMLVALALTTPSTGFILDSLSQLGLSDTEKFWIRSKAIAAELVALAVLFFVLQTTTVVQFATSISVMAALVFFLPLVFRFFAIWVLPYAPKTEFTFMIIVAVVAAFVTLRLGVYYLVGAFVVGLIAHRFRHQLPALKSDQTIHAVEVFAAFFIPFYFLYAGLHLQASDFSAEAILVGAAFLAIFIPLRLLSTAAHRWIILGEPFSSSLRIGTSLVPTLVFTLVIAMILRDQFNVPQYLFGGLIVYTLGNTLIPGFAIGLPPQAFMAPEAETDLYRPEPDVRPE